MDLRLQQEVRFITTALGQIVAEQAGETTFQQIENLRSLCKKSRLGEAQSYQKIDRMLAKLSREKAYAIAHAFSLFFQLVNLCEERQRSRRLATLSDRPQSVKKLFQELKKAGVTSAQIQACLDEIEIQPVLTSHPTEAKRLSVQHQILRLNQNFDSPNEVLEALWQTEEVRERTISPLDEVVKTLFWFEHTILETISNFYADLDEVLQEFYPEVKCKNRFLTFASWVGGDRDGNPFVTPDVSKQTMALHRDLMVKTYMKQCEELVRELSHKDLKYKGGKTAVSIANHSDRFREQIAVLRKKFSENPPEIKSFHRELSQIRDRLLDQNAKRTANGRIRKAISQIEACKYHLAELDFRGHSSTLQENPGAIFEELKTIRQLQHEYGVDAANHYIVSMTHDADQLISVLGLARKAGLQTLHIVPLFETIEDLERCDIILSNLWRNGAYRAHLLKQNDLQEVMFGYSDSNKDGGYFAANWWLYMAQKKVFDAAKPFGIKLRLFHGKGGTIDRGGGLSYRSVRAQPHAVGDGKVRITEQGEVVSLKYSTPKIAQRNLEQLTSSVIGAYFHETLDGLAPKELSYWESSMQTVSRLAMNYYRQLVYQTPEFETYFWEATPIDLIDHLRIGSRPSRRRTTRDIRQLRTIPWVFAWTQSRHLISAWYGVGSGLRQFIDETPNGFDLLREMYQKWPFFSMLIDNVEVSLAKADMHIARKYAGLVKDRDVAERIFSRIEQEHSNSVEMVLKICGRQNLLQNQPVLSESIRLRNPYVDPLNYIQIRYLPEWRDSIGKGGFPKDLYRLLALTVNGIAFGMKSTG